MKKRLLLASFIIACSFLFASCGESEEVAAHAPSPTPIPTPTPTRYAELTFYESESDVVINGEPVDGFLAAGKGDTIYVPLEDALFDIESSLDSYEYIGTSTIRKNYTFTYDGKEYELTPDSNVCTVDGVEKTFTDKTIEYSNRQKIYVSIDSFAEIVDMQVIYDESNDTYYVTDKNNFTPTPGVKVPVLCFYGVGQELTEGSTSLHYNHSLFVHQDLFSSMIEELQANGYEPIFFEDLDHLEDYNKPVIIMFCTNTSNIYSTAFPLLKAYKVKANVFAYPDELGTNYSLTMNQLKEMYKSGFVSIQGGGVVRESGGEVISDVRQELDIEEACLDVLRATGKLPVAYSYGSEDAKYSEQTWNIAKEYFSLGVSTVDAYETYVTGTDDNNIPVQIFVSYSTVTQLMRRIDDPEYTW